MQLLDYCPPGSLGSLASPRSTELEPVAERADLELECEEAEVDRALMTGIPGDFGLAASTETLEASWESAVLELLRCADAVVEGVEVGSYPRTACASQPPRDFSRVLERRFRSLRFLAEQQADLARRIETKEALLRAERRELQAALDQRAATLSGLDDCAERMVAAEARLEDAERRSLLASQEALHDVQLWESQVDECEEAASHIDRARSDLASAMEARIAELADVERQALELERESAALERQALEVHLREHALVSLETAWEGVSDGAQMSDAVARLSQELLRNDDFVKQLLHLVETAGEVGGVPSEQAAQDLDPLGAQWDEERVSAASTAADLDEEGDAPGSMQWDASASAESPAARSDGLASCGTGQAALPQPSESSGHFLVESQSWCSTPSAKAAQDGALSPQQSSPGRGGLARPSGGAPEAASSSLHMHVAVRRDPAGLDAPGGDLNRIHGPGARWAGPMGASLPAAAPHMALPRQVLSSRGLPHAQQPLLMSSPAFLPLRPYAAPRPPLYQLRPASGS